MTIATPLSALEQEPTVLDQNDALLIALAIRVTTLVKRAVTEANAWRDTSTEADVSVHVGFAYQGSLARPTDVGGDGCVRTESPSRQERPAHFANSAHADDLDSRHLSGGSLPGVTSITIAAGIIQTVKDSQRIRHIKFKIQFD